MYEKGIFIINITISTSGTRVTEFGFTVGTTLYGEKHKDNTIRDMDDTAFKYIRLWCCPPPLCS